MDSTLAPRPREFFDDAEKFRIVLDILKIVDYDVWKETVDEYTEAEEPTDTMCDIVVYLETQGVW